MIEPSPGTTRTSATLLLVATFTLGMIAGAAILHIARMSLGGPPPFPPPGPPPIEHLAHELDLRPEQVEQLRGILDESRERLHGEAEATRERIRAILTPEQLARFETMRPPHPPGPGFPPPRGPRRRPQGPGGFPPPGG